MKHKPTVRVGLAVLGLFAVASAIWMLRGAGIGREGKSSSLVTAQDRPKQEVPSASVSVVQAQNAAANTRSVAKGAADSKADAKASAGSGVTAMTVQSGNAQSDSAGWKPAASLRAAPGVEPVRCRVLQADAETVSLEYAMPKPVLEPVSPEAVAAMVGAADEEGNVLCAGGSRPRTAVVNELMTLVGTRQVVRVKLGSAPNQGGPGRPELPVTPSKTILPAGREIASVEVVLGKKVTLLGKYFLPPGQKPIPLLPDAQAEYTPPNATIYGGDDPFPGTPNSQAQVQRRRGVAFAMVNLNPVEYKPASGEISYYESVSLKINTKPAAASSDIPYRSDPLRPLDSGIDNPETLSTYGTPPPAKTTPSGGATPLGGTTSVGPCDPALSYQYVVVTSKAIRDAATTPNVNDLLAQKRAAGLSATVVAIEDILAGYPGVDNAEKLRNFIKDAYANWETDFVLLGGDTQIIPLRELMVGGAQIPSDLYYQCLDGNYNYDFDGDWGETTDGVNGGDVDLLAEVYVGRASAESPEEFANFVFKTLGYENEADSDDHLRRTMIAGEYLGSQFGPGIFSYAVPYMEEIRLGAATSGYTTAGFESFTGITVDRFYDYPNGWEGNPTSFSWNGAQMIEKLNANTYSLINHLGHANFNYVMRFYNGDADGLTNDKFFFLNSQGCIPGAFDMDCIAERLTTSTRHGAFAAVLNSRYGYGNYNDAVETMDGPSQRIQRQFWDAYFGENILNLGALNADSHEDNIWCINAETEDGGGVIRWCLYESNLFGDPHTPLRAMPSDPLVKYHTSTIGDDSPGGDGDGIVNPGETVSLGVSLKNLGLKATQGVSATLTTADAYVTVTDPTAAFGDMPGLGAVRPGLDPFAIVVSGNCPTPHEATLNLGISNAAGVVWTDSFKITVYTSYHVSGVVTLDGAPAAGVTIQWSGPLSGSRVTDDTGQYVFGTLAGASTVMAKKGGWLDCAPVAVTVPPGVTGVNFAFTNATVSGRVTDSLTGSAIPGATIEYAGALNGSVTSDGDGHYEFTRAYGQAATLSVTVRKAGYFDQERTVTIPPHAAAVDFALAYSDIEVTPTAIDVTATRGEVVTRTITIRNHGAADLTWSINPPGRVLPSVRIANLGNGGVAFDGDALWVLQNSPHKYDPLTGAPLGDIGVRYNGESSYRSGLDWDGVNLWTLAGTQRPGVWPIDDDGWIHGVDPLTGTIGKTLTWPGDAYSVSGVAVGDGYVWVNGWTWDGAYRFKVWKIDPATDTIAASWVLPEQAAVFDNWSGLEYLDGAIWIVYWTDTAGQAIMYKLDAANGQVLQSFPAPYGTGERIYDLAQAGSRTMWVLAFNSLLYSGEACLIDLGDEPWMSEAPRTGTVPGGGMQEVELTLDTVAAGLGVHESTYRIVSNDPDQPEVLVPVKFTVLANPANRAPVIAEGASVSVTMSEEGNPTPFSLSLHATDADGDPLTWTIAGAPGHGAALALGVGSEMPIAYMPALNYFGADSFAVQVADGKGGTATITVNVTIQNINETPTASASASPMVGLAPLAVAFAATGSDIDGDTLTYAWNFGTGDPSDHSNQANPSFSYTNVGRYTATVTVSDPGGLSAQATVTITVAASADMTRGAVYAWGNNGWGQLGNGTTTGCLLPVRVAGISGAASVAAGCGHTTVRMPDGTIINWGDNSYGELGDGTFTSRLTPQQPAALTGGTAIAAESIQAYVIKAGGTVWACGRNDYGQLGDGTTTDHNLPVQVVLEGDTPFSGVASIAVGGDFAVALRDDGTVWGCGYNGYGALGDGTRDDRHNPVQAKMTDGTPLSGIKAVGAGIYHTLTVKEADGTVWSYGRNSHGCLGNGDQITSSRCNPVRVVLADGGTPLTGVVAVDGGFRHSVALKGDGTVWTWGDNTYGELGTGGGGQRAFAAQVTDISNVTAVAAGEYYTLALKVDGTLWAWGNNGYGQLGDGTTVSRTLPVRVQGIGHVTAVAAHMWHTVALVGPGQGCVVTDVQSVTVPEGGTTTFQVKLSQAPEADAIVSVRRVNGDSSLTVQSGDSLTFTPANWDTYQSVTMAAAEDQDAANGTATIECSAPELNSGGVTTVEVENDTTLAVYGSSGGVVSPPDPVVVGKGVATPILATPDVGCPFVNWTVLTGSATIADPNAANTTVTITAPAQIRANFATRSNRAPVIATPAWAGPNPVTLPAGSTVHVAASDPDGDMLTYAWVQVSGPGTAAFATPTMANGGVTFSAAGSYVLRATVTDSRGGSATSDVTVTVMGGTDRDTDGDGLLDSVDPDDDNDGMSDADEAVAGTIPTNRLSVLCLTASEFRASSSQFVIRWQSASNRWYTVQAATNLLTGFNLNLRTNIFATPPENVHTDSVTGVGCRFYRVRVE